MKLASKTLALIDDTISSDDGARFKGLLKSCMASLDDAYDDEVRATSNRKHLGASGIGNECTRKVFYGFRWSIESINEGRNIRLWNRGHMEEGRFIAMLKMIGVVIHQYDSKGKQIRLKDCGGHFGGSTDGAGKGIPDLDADEWALLEFKTVNDKGFKELIKIGVQAYSLTYYVQMQVYMRKLKLNRALFMCVNKNTDHIHAEIVDLKPDYADSYIKRAHDIIFYRPGEYDNELPSRISNSPGWYKCKWCDYKNICHKHEPPALNCRTCKNVDIHYDGTWSCTLDSRTLDEAAQLAACESYNREF